jgi:hypothetical protein
VVNPIEDQPLTFSSVDEVKPREWPSENLDRPQRVKPDDAVGMNEAVSQPKSI